MGEPVDGGAPAPRASAPVSPPAAAPGPAEPGAGSYAQARAIRETYNARLARLAFEEKAGKLIDADQVKTTWFKHIIAAKTKIMGIPSACKLRVPELPLTAVAEIEKICRETLEDLARAHQ